MQRSSVMFRIEGVDGAEPRLVAREELIQIFAGMCQSDLVTAHTALLGKMTTTHVDRLYYMRMEARGLLELLELHTRAVNALQGLLALRDPDELVEAHIR